MITVKGESVLGVLTLVTFMLVHWSLSLARDLGSREHLVLAVQHDAYAGQILRMEESGHRVRDLSAGQRGMRRFSARFWAIPAVIACLGFLAVWTIGWPSVPVALAVGVAVAFFGAFDELIMRGFGLADPERRHLREMPALVFAMILKCAMCAGGFWVAVAAVALINSGWWIYGLVGISLSSALLRAAHVPAVWAERWARRRRQPSFGNTATDETLLFLRGFDDDSISIRSPIGVTGPARAVIPSVRVRFEEHLAFCLMRNGLLSAIGRPGEMLPELGAARTYWPDDAWQEAVRTTANRCRAVFVVAGNTDGLKWELEQLREWGLLSKTLILFPPDADRTKCSKRFKAAYGYLGLGQSPVKDWEPFLWTALGCDDDGNPVHYLSTGRDWCAYLATIVHFVGEKSGNTKQSPDQALKQAINASEGNEHSVSATTTVLDPAAAENATLLGLEVTNLDSMPSFRPRELMGLHNARTLILHANQLQRKNDLAGALRSYEMAVIAAPDDANVLYDFANFLRKNIDDAVRTKQMLDRAAKAGRRNL